MVSLRLPLAATGLALLAAAQGASAVRNLLGGEAGQAVLYLVWGCGLAFAAWGLGRPADEDRIPTAVMGFAMAATAGAVRLGLVVAAGGVDPGLWPLLVLAAPMTVAAVLTARLRPGAPDAWWYGLGIRVAVAATAIGYGAFAVRLASAGLYPVLPFTTFVLGIGGASVFVVGFRPAPLPASLGRLTAGRGGNGGSRLRRGRAES